MLIPAALTERCREVLDRPRPADLPTLKPRERESHKGTYGRALVIGGSLGMAGAVGLAGMATIRAGAGLVRLGVPTSIIATVAAYEPAYMTAPLTEDSEGRLAAAAADSIVDLTTDITALAVGPGLSRSSGLDTLVAQLFADIRLPAVFDADALNALAVDPKQLASHAGPRILTPHPGEFQRLLGGKKVDGRAAQEAAARELAGRCQCVVVLKGHRTFVTDGSRDYTNKTGNPGMATGGTGDVLTGITTGLLCQGLVPLDAAQLAVYVHGLAGDLAAAELGEPSLSAVDVVRYLPPALRSVVA